jgi:hypothetical protein
MVKQVETEADQAILMRDQNPLYLAALNLAMIERIRPIIKI